MKWEMVEVVEIEAVLEKIWDLHDKLSDAILSISRMHFLKSIKKTTRIPEKKKKKSPFFTDVDDEKRTGFVFVKDFRVDDDDSTIQEAKSLNAIRTALENLEDQLEFFHTVQMQQRAERDAAIARLEQSRLVLAMRLTEHHGKKYKVIEEALAFVGDVHDAGLFVSPENLFGSPLSPSGKNFLSCEGNKSSTLMKVLISSLNLAKSFLKLDHMGEILGNTALVAVSMLALLHFHQVGYKDNFDWRQDINNSNRNVMRTSRLEGSSRGSLSQLDVLLARG